MGKAPSFVGFKPSSEKASRNLAKIKGTETAGEKLLRSTLWRLGFRFRKNVKTLPGKPDVVFPTEKVAVFCDGDFWHGRNWAKDRRRLRQGSNAPYWLAKIAANRKRDRLYNRELERLGWSVIRFWDSDVRADADGPAKEVAALVISRRR